MNHGQAQALTRFPHMPNVAKINQCRRKCSKELVSRRRQSGQRTFTRTTSASMGHQKGAKPAKQLCGKAIAQVTPTQQAADFVSNNCSERLDPTGSDGQMIA